MIFANFPLKRIVTVGGALLIASGYFVRSDEPDTVSFATAISVPRVDVSPLLEGDSVPSKSAKVAEKQVVPTPVAPLPESVFLTDTPLVLASLSMGQPVTRLLTDMTLPRLTCALELSAETAPSAMVTLMLDAPCMTNERFTLHHSGMVFTDATDAHGRRTLSVPALASDAVYSVSFSNGDQVVARTTVGSLEEYHRVVVQWTGESGLQIHAFEYGADYDEPGHVWVGDMRELSVAARGEGGFMVRYGTSDFDNARMAEVYTFPSGEAARPVDVRLSLEAEVTSANCGRDVAAQSIQLSHDGGLKVQDVALAVPDCGAIGDFLVLKNILNDLKIARN